jgi:hypothetical protein
MLEGIVHLRDTYIPEIAVATEIADISKDRGIYIYETSVNNIIDKGNGSKLNMKQMRNVVKFSAKANINRYSCLRQEVQEVAKLAALTRSIPRAQLERPEK